MHASWTLIGAVAAASYRASQRPTDDVDYLVEWDERLVPSLVDAGFDVRLIEDQDKPQMIHAQRSDGRADIVIASTECQRIAAAHAVDHVLTVEDVLIHKLIAWPPGTRTASDPSSRPTLHSTSNSLRIGLENGVSRSDGKKRGLTAERSPHESPLNLTGPRLDARRAPLCHISDPDAYTAPGFVPPSLHPPPP